MTAHLLAHTNLLAPFDGTGRYHPLDAVIVPAGRPAEHTRAAAAIAHMTDAELLVLCSQKAEPVAVARVVAEEHVARSHVVGVPADYQSGLLPSPPPTIQAEQASRPDLSRKRNLGLAVARMAGWRTVLLVDDDITLDVGDVVAAQYALDATPAVGFPIEDWPDNSAIGHANRMSGGAQEVFVGPSALLVDVEAASLGQFPTIYNEGSLFLFDASGAENCAKSGIGAAQGSGGSRRKARADSPTRGARGDRTHRDFNHQAGRHQVRLCALLGRWATRIQDRFVLPVPVSVGPD